MQLSSSGGANTVSDNTVYVRGNDDTAILNSAANGDIKLSENGTTRLFIKRSTGNVGIGTSTPTALLDVEDSGATNNAWNTLAKFRPDVSDAPAEASIHIESFPSTTSVPNRRSGIQAISDSGVALPLLLNRSGGNVGIGTTAPYGLTHWKKSSTVNLVATNTGADGQADTTVMSLIGQARGYSNNLSKLASIDFKTDPTTWYYGAITFNVANLDGTDTSRTPLEAMRINRLGNVGIGTDSPGATLHIGGQEASAPTAGTVDRLHIHPYSNTGGP
jgi:hypothetical protein